MEKCFDKLRKLRQEKSAPSILLTTPSGLNRICKVIKDDFVGCILSYLSKCGTPLHKELSKVLSDAILEHMDVICSPKSEMRDDIVSVSSCLHEKVLSQPGYQKQCNEPFFTTIAWGEMNAHDNHPKRPPMDYIIDAGCCAYRRWEECSMPQIMANCEDDGERVIQTVLSKLLGGVPDFMCSKQTFNSESKICRLLPTLEQQKSMVNITHHDEQKFSMFSLIKFFLARDHSGA
ncbi:hypothetical protein RDWZM_004346 [Blomia tropicalis]|uniref:Uncharacterized protein n=1 Tax=Blomia tropicalis TaxID=40697 RepID=A0A9Q0RTF1_BLOTA|nr:hypothetical protein RDWZM_004346 [Blomia tropicalis]